MLNRNNDLSTDIFGAHANLIAHLCRFLRNLACYCHCLKYLFIIHFFIPRTLSVSGLSFFASSMSVVYFLWTFVFTSTETTSCSSNTNDWLLFFSLPDLTFRCHNNKACRVTNREECNNFERAYRLDLELMISKSRRFWTKTLSLLLKQSFRSDESTFFFWDTFCEVCWEMNCSCLKKNFKFYDFSLQSF